MNTTGLPSTQLLDSPRLRAWARLRPWRSCAFLLRDYACVALVAGGVVWFHSVRSAGGLHWAWEVPVVLLAVFLMGCLQHRIALMGHEASHGMLHSNRAWNDWLANLLIFYPLFSTLTMYRERHLGHHLHPNDPVHDPNLSGGKLERIWARFPMTKERFVACYYLKFFWPPFVLRNLLDLFLVLALENRGASAGHGSSRWRPGLLGAGYFIVISVVTLVSVWRGVSSWGVVSGLYLLAVIGWALLPAAAFSSGGSFAGSLKSAALLRLSFCTLLALVLGALAEQQGGGVILGFLILWVLPLLYVFPYLMLLREIYQHANAGTGEMDNTRIMHVDVFTRWALLAYGNDLHLIHHIYPNIPHDRLAEVHETLMRESSHYRAGVQQTFGVVRAAGGGSSLLDTLASATAGERDADQDL
ncbi:fatty acid desaturase [Prosthecobacter sp.]|uniref:fatty acid desaturase family protein n=1 Tax=Prosthecobacter sp. TaxID=1965333 RepID=UPI002ABA33D2|nr:fatty acid desaturase [Prosthecobacter sp.]MDZ4403435.1 fatty acid desaturase [Prosthecobacter sp.]